MFVQPGATAAVQVRPLVSKPLYTEANSQTCETKQQTALHGVLASVSGNQNLSPQTSYEKPQQALHFFVQRYHTSDDAFVHRLN